MQRFVEKVNLVQLVRNVVVMESSHAQYFAAYLAQGVGRVGKDYLRSSATSALAGDAISLQLFYNLLPEFGSLPWMMKPVLVLLSERWLSARGRQWLMALSSLFIGAAWMCLPVYELNGVFFLSVTGLLSLGSALVDGLVDGQISAESVDPATAVKLQYICQNGQAIGALYVGLIAWTLSLSKSTSLILTGVAWAAVAPFVLMSRRASSDRQRHCAVDERKHHEHESAKSDSGKPRVDRGVLSWLVHLVNTTAGLVTILSFAVCLSPSLDVFLFRQHVLKLTPSQQALVSVAGTFGWFFGTVVYKFYIAKGRSPEKALMLCLTVWPIMSLVTIAFAAFARTGAWALWFAMLEKVACEFGKAMTFMPTTVLQQLHTPQGYEGTAFTLMQSGGTFGMVLSRNLEWVLMGFYGVEPKLGSQGFDSLASVALATSAWRFGTAIIVALSVVPLLNRGSSWNRSE